MCPKYYTAADTVDLVIKIWGVLSMYLPTPPHEQDMTQGQFLSGI